MQLLQRQRDAMTADITPQEIEDTAVQFVNALTSKPYNIDEVKLLYNEFREYSRHALKCGYFTVEDNNSALTRITKIFQPFNYKDTRSDKALKGLHILFDKYKTKDFSENFISNISSDELNSALTTMVEILKSLQNDTTRHVLQNEIHRAILGMKVGYGNITPHVEEDYFNYLQIAALLGFYEPGTESEVAFITQCKVFSGIADPVDYINAQRISAEDIELAARYEGKTNVFGGD